MSSRTYYVYMMSSASQTLYVGVTNNLQRRVFEHKDGKAGSFTTRYNVNRLVYLEMFEYIDHAIAREKEIKKLTRRAKVKLIRSMNPEWKDLSEGD